MLWFPNLTCSQPKKLGKVILSIFRGFLCQSVHPESNLTHFRSFYLFNSGLCFLLKSCLRVRASNMKIIFVPSLKLVSVSLRRLFQWSLAYFGAWFANESTQNKSNFCKFSLLDSALWFFIKTLHRLKKSTLK